MLLLILLWLLLQHRFWIEQACKGYEELVYEEDNEDHNDDDDDNNNGDQEDKEEEENRFNEIGGYRPQPSSNVAVRSFVKVATKK